MKFFWLITLCFFLTGCSSSYVAVPLTRTETGLDDPEHEYPQVSRGTEVRLTLRDGRVLKGRFDGFLDESVVISEARLEGNTRDGYYEIQQTETDRSDQQYRISWKDLALFEKDTGDKGNEGARTIATVGAMAAVGYMLVNASFNADYWD